MPPFEYQSITGYRELILDLYSKMFGGSKSSHCYLHCKFMSTAI